ncbi:ABC protein [Sanghuangporus baumii]|uniref:ABC protein n=1 Tax=Sanghuangporus baumii TaxID=108892 RepID=A0A9Q5NBY2_SANBA|nr:ABC protein [Sanghuangporus baumii]
MAGSEKSEDVEKSAIDVSMANKTRAGDFRIQQLDIGEIENAVYREKWWQIWRPKNPPPPPRASLEDAPVIPIAHASIISKLTYSWITELMVLGYQRTLQVPDLWKMDPSRESGLLSAKLDEAWSRRVHAAEEWNRRLSNGEVRANIFKRASWNIRALLPSSKAKGKSYSERRAAFEERWRESSGVAEASIAWAMNDVVGDTSQLMTPLLVKAIINFSKEGSHGGAQVARGVGMAIGLFLLTVTASICQHQFFWRSMSTGVLARAALISSIYKRGVMLTPKARTTLNNAALVNHISTDVSRIDACSQWFHAAWTAPIQVTVCLIILLVQLGPSALAGFSLFIFMVPVQERLMTFQHKRRQRANIWTDGRANLILEVLGGMRVVKYFSYEIPFLKRIFEIRGKELDGIRGIQFARAANIAMSYSVPVLAATLAFVTYTNTSNSFDVAVIFASFSLFQLLRQPLMFLPRALSAIADAESAITRLQKVFHAQLREDVGLDIDVSLDVAIKVEHATFEWEESAPQESFGAPGDKRNKDKDKKSRELTKKLEAIEDEKTDIAPFRVRDVNMVVPIGQLVAIVGRVGSGKSSLLQGLIGEMRRVEGQVKFGGRVGYCSQTAWIQNASLRDNVLFGQEFDSDKYWDVVERASLLADLAVLPDGDLTEIGEKGINLSGGQKQRINIARALYYDADIVILDDPLSAVDAHVGKALFQDAILSGLKSRGKTVILVTHALHFLSQCDYIYAMASGIIGEHGTYAELMEKGGEFSRLAREFGGDQEQEEEIEALDEGIDSKSTKMQSAGDSMSKEKMKAKVDLSKVAGKGTLEGRLMVKEKRTTGAVPWHVYGTYIKAGRGYLTVPLIIVFMLLMQGSQVLNSYTLVWWEGDMFHRPFSFYQILYAMLGIAQSLFTLLLGIAMDVLSDFASRNLHHDALHNIFYAPMSFFDTTPLGRILGVFGKDIDTIDNQLSLSMRMFVISMASVFGAVVIITILEHYFLVVAFFIAVGYCYFAAFYRASAREMKRLDSLLRSLLYSHFSESLTGLPTIRSYGETDRFLKDNRYYVDLEDRALFLTITNQRWMAIRLDFMGGLLVFFVAIFAVTGVSGINPAQIGLVLTYTTQLTQLCGMVTRQYAEMENYMNSVERVVHYSRGDLIPQEPPHEIEGKKPDSSWPQRGAISFDKVTMSYRLGLPKVLKGITLDAKGGEKIGVVGRTGAGKSSLMLALFRIVELNSGKITIDDVDISQIGLKDLRTKISIIPQDPLLFSGTIRSNLDPFGLYDDARLWDALRRAYLVDSIDDPSAISDKQDIGKNEELDVNDSLHEVEEGGERAVSTLVSGSVTPVRRFTLDTTIESEGSNLSVGERSLLSLARALVKDCKVVVLDEATASVDLETDSKIQHTIQTEFSDRTLLCIAHRLRTILSYDRILVLDSGEVANGAHMQRRGVLNFFEKVWTHEQPRRQIGQMRSQRTVHVFIINTRTFRKTNVSFSLPPIAMKVLERFAAVVSGLGIAILVSASNPLLVRTTSGPVLGFLDNTTVPTTPLQKWYGIRYAQDTSGARRWRPPKRFVDNSGRVFNASEFGPACMQGRTDGGNGTSVQSEDCLRINVIAPIGAKDLPVYIYSYYNYRLSLWAWPHAKEIADAGETQNFGLLDTRAAIEWVRDNARAFGGDPTKIVLGEIMPERLEEIQQKLSLAASLSAQVCFKVLSAKMAPVYGSEMTNFYMSAWPNDPIIRGAVMQSSDTSQPQWQVGNQLETISKNLSCPTGVGQLDCLRTKSGVALQDILLSSGNQFQPVIDNITIFKDYVKQIREGRTARIPLALEMYPSPSEQYPSVYNATSAIWRDAHMLCLAHNLGKWRTEMLGQKVWRYRFDLVANNLNSLGSSIGTFHAHNLGKWRTEALGQKVWRYRFDLVADNLNSLGSSIGTFHGEDIRFVMGTTDTIVLSPPFMPVTPFEQKVSDYMVEAWTNFVKDPMSGPQIPGWDLYDPKNNSTLAILGTSESGAIPGDHFAIDESCEYWNTILPIYPQVRDTILN